MNREDFANHAERCGWEVPAFTVTTFAKPRSDYALVIPVLNEGDRLCGQLERMKSIGAHRDFDIMIVDGGSTDGSLDEDFLRSVKVSSLLRKTGPGRLSAQLRCAYAWALFLGYPGIVTIDGNGKDGVESLSRFKAALDEGVDYAQASRFIAGGHADNTPLSRCLAIRLLHAPLTSLAARKWLTDTTQGYRAYSRRYLLDPRVRPFRNIFSRYELLAYLAIRAGQLGFSVREIPTRRAYPRHGKVPTKISGFRGWIDLFVTLMKAVSGAYAPSSRNQTDAS